jgi:hypothetical protein
VSVSDDVGPVPVTPTAVEEAVRRLVSAAPVLTEDQRAALAVLLRPESAAAGSSASRAS